MTLQELEAENKKLRGIIARNAMQRLQGEEATKMHVTPEDIQDSLDILYAFQNETHHAPGSH